MSVWLLRNRVLVFAVINGALDLAMLVLGPLHQLALGQVLYTALLLALCSAPLALLDAFNGRRVLLLIFMTTYFMHFGGIDLQHILLGDSDNDGGLPAPARAGLVTPAEMLVLGGGLLLLAGYLGVSWPTRISGAAVPAEWPKAAMLIVGLGLWASGTTAVIYLAVFVTPEAGNQAQQRGLTYLGSVGTFVVMLGHLLQPLGLLILAYAYARFRGVFWTALMIAVLVVQLATGFITDVKTTALIGVVVVVVTRLLVDNKLPLTWIAASVVGVLLIFPIFQANRMQVTGERGLNHLQALQNIGKVLQIAIESRDKVNDVRVADRPPTFVERTYIKDNLEQVVQHVGTDVPYLHGASLTDVAFAFLPRLLVGDKQSFSMGQLFTHEIAHSDTDTYISISHLGELFWNFGWLGALVGMGLVGVLLGVTGSRLSLADGVSLTRVMVLLTTVQNLCVGFEGEISISYVVWLRSVAAIGLLHLVFARRAGAAARLDSAAQVGNQAAGLARGAIRADWPHQAAALPASGARHPNVMP